VKVKVGNYQDFAKFVSGTTKALDLRHTNIVTDTNGTVASVYFDFVFLHRRATGEPGERDVAG
jgi:hypothetical protein